MGIGGRHPVQVRYFTPEAAFRAFHREPMVLPSSLKTFFGRATETRTNSWVPSQEGIRKQGSIDNQN